MGTISRVTTWSTGDTLTASDLNGEFDNILSTANGSLNADNLGVTAGQAAASKAIVLDSNKDFANATGSNQIRNLTLSGSLKIGTTFLPDAAGGADLGSTSLEWGDVYVADDKYLYMGSDQNIKIGYDETTTDSLAISAIDGADLVITLRADRGDDAGDEWKLNVADGGVITLGNDIASAGTFVTHLTLTPHATITSSTLALAGALTVAGTAAITGVATVGGLTIGSAVINEADLEQIDDLTAGTVTASKAVVVDSNRDIGTFRNITLDGTLSDGNYTFDTSGNVSGLGTIGSGAITSSGIIKTDDATEATTTTDGSLQTDGGLSVVKDAIFGDDVRLLSDAAVLALGAGNDATLTHDGTTGVTIAANPIIVDSGGNLTLDAHTGIHIFKDAGTEVLRFTESSSGQVTIKLATNGKNLVFTDNGDATNMTILDAAAGINVPGEVQTTKIAYTDGDDAITIADGGGITTAGTLATTGAATLASLVCTAGATFGGGYDDTGVTISTAGVLQANGAITSDGAVTGATLAGTISTAAQNSITSASSLATVGTITSGTWSGVIDGSATMTLGSDATGDIYYRDASGFLERLASGADGYILTGTGAGSIPAWEAAASSGGDFSGPGSATDNAVVRFNGTGGKTGQNSGVTIDDSNNVTGFGTLATSGAATLASLVCTAGATFGGGYDDTGVTISTAGVITADGDITSDGTLFALGDTAASDKAAMGYTTADGLVLTGQGSTSDVTIKNDADTTVLSIPTGTTYVGIGTTAATQPLHVVTSSGANITFQLNNDSGENTFTGKRSRGSEGSPTAIQSGDTIMNIGGEGYDGSSYAFRGGLKLLAAENWSGSARGTKWAFYGATAGQAGADSDPWVTMTNGSVSIGTTATTGPLTVRGKISTLASDGTDYLFMDHDGSIGKIGTTYTGGGAYSPVTFFTSDTERLRIDTAGDFTGSSSADISDERLKENVVELTGCLAQINALRGISYNFLPEAKKNDMLRYGLIAQEVEAVIPAIVWNKSVHDIEAAEAVDAVLYTEAVDEVLYVEGDEIPEDKNIGDVKTPAINIGDVKTPASDAVDEEIYKSLHYTGLIPVFIEAIKELTTRLETSEAKITALEAA
jgi:hypothetical protein